MRLTKDAISVETLKEALNPIFEEHGVKCAMLFGSYAKGTQIPESDIDIYVDSGLRGLKFFGLLEDIVNALPAPVDLIERRCVYEDGPLMREIKRTGVLLYGNFTA